MSHSPLHRRHRMATAVSALVLVAGGAGGATLAGATPAAAASAFPAHYAAPYLQINDGDAGDMAADLSATGDQRSSRRAGTSSSRLAARAAARSPRPARRSRP